MKLHHRMRQLFDKILRSSNRVMATLASVGTGLTLQRFLTRLIWISVLPLLVLVAYLAFDSVSDDQSQRDLTAANLAQNLATAIDHELTARIQGLQLLAGSPLADDAMRRADFYREAQGYFSSFGSHVILTDLSLQMLINTRVPWGTQLPMLPRPKGRAAAPLALETGQAVVGDVVFGPVANEPLVAIAVPLQFQGKAAYVLLTTLAASQFQQRLQRVALPDGWALTLVDGTGAVIAQRASSSVDPATGISPGVRFVAVSALSPWSVRVEIPARLYRAPQVAAATAMALLVLGATLIGVLGGSLAARRLGHAVRQLAHPGRNVVAQIEIAEICAVRELLDEAARQRSSAEAETRKLNAELEQRVAERTAQLTQVNQELDTFAYSVSHDLKTPLRGIDGYSVLLQEECAAQLSADGRLFVDNIRQGARQMNVLIDDLLAYSRMERRTLQRQPLSLSDLAHAVVAEQAQQIERQSADVRLSMPELMVQADRDGVAVVLRNLLENALKFSRASKSALIEIGGRDDGTTCTLWVRDNGIGFDMQFHDRIFEIFQRLQRSEDYPGTGIGLALVSKAVSRMGGRVWAESTPGTGATFYISLPKYVGPSASVLTSGSEPTKEH